MRRNADTCAGDVLVLSKPLGVGVLLAALKKSLLEADGCAGMLCRTTQFNRVGEVLAHVDGLHAMTDHRLWIGRPPVASLPRLGPLCATALGRAALDRCRPSVNAAGHCDRCFGLQLGGHGNQVLWPHAAPEWQRSLFADPQTSGGLLVSCSEAAVPVVLDAFRDAEFAQAAAVGGNQSNTAG